MTQELFRREVFGGRRAHWQGTVTLAQPLPIWLLMIGTGFAALAIVLFLLLGSYTRRSTVAGQLVPSKGLATVLSPATGVVEQLDTIEGGDVHAGQRVAVVITTRVLAEGIDAMMMLEQRIEQRRKGLMSMQSAQQSQLQAQASGLQAQLTAAQRELAQIETEIATRQDQVRIAKETLVRLKQLEDNHYVSALQIKQQESTTLDYAGQTQTLQRQAIITRRSIAQLEQALHELPSQQQAIQAALQRDLAQLAQEQVETEVRGALAVTAPVSGVVTTQVAKPGQAVLAGQPLLSLLPSDSPLEAELLVPSRAIGFVEFGDTVLLRYQAYPHQKFGHKRGRIAQISRSALTPSELGALIGKAQTDEPFYRVTVALDSQFITAYGKPEPLKPGMLLDADILGEKRSLIEWTFEPLYSLRGKFSN